MSNPSDTSNENTKSEESSGGLLTHLIELRQRTIYVLIAIGITFLCLIPFAQTLYDWLALPVISQLPNNGQLISVHPAAGPLVPIKLAFLVAVVLMLPWLFYQLWCFVAPGLFQQEKRLILPLLTSSVLLFYFGMAFVYFVVLPLLFQFLPNFLPSTVQYIPDIGYYLNFVITLFFAFGFSFEMPVFTVLLIQMGLTSRQSLSKKRPYIIVGAFTIGMLLTPPDVISQITLAIPICLLFELGLWVSRLLEGRLKASKLEDEVINQGMNDP